MDWHSLNGRYKYVGLGLDATAIDICVDDASGSKCKGNTYVAHKKQRTQLAVRQHDRSGAPKQRQETDTETVHLVILRRHPEAQQANRLDAHRVLPERSNQAFVPEGREDTTYQREHLPQVWPNFASADIADVEFKIVSAERTDR